MSLCIVERQDSPPNGVANTDSVFRINDAGVVFEIRRGQGEPPDEKPGTTTDGTTAVTTARRVCFCDKF